jgi:hypothetical protein
MTGRITIERLLRDDDDASGQSIRKWKIESEAGHVTIRLDHGEGFILLRSADIDQFVIDLSKAGDAADDLAAEASKS